MLFIICLLPAAELLSLSSPSLEWGRGGGPRHRQTNRSREAPGSVRLERAGMLALGELFRSRHEMPVRGRGGHEQPSGVFAAAAVVAFVVNQKSIVARLTIK